MVMAFENFMGGKEKIPRNFNQFSKALFLGVIKSQDCVAKS